MNKQIRTSLVEILVDVAILRASRGQRLASNGLIDLATAVAQERPNPFDRLQRTSLAVAEVAQVNLKNKKGENKCRTIK